MSAAFVRNGRLDVIAHNALGRALHAPMFDSPTTDKRGRPTFARDHFLDGRSRPVSQRAVHDLSLCTAEPGSASEDRLQLLASLAATPAPAAEPTGTQPTPPRNSH
ncbi:hypothetical protein R6L23_05605 [Streptomyces sp. SR27]|uniref:MmyB family transcriptional regulator n=1 Tax=Streptomyces sp. SR27 TaxID=3076630 RepID=UPI00295BEBD1|nr:hypothetical protein [Streptomyces sp. SR27]MDV9187694.1 hypothetical protein [Streptomyces sp. SR27]